MKDEKPEAVILFADPDQMSALVHLTHYCNPLSRDRITTLKVLSIHPPSGRE